MLQAPLTQTSMTFLERVDLMDPRASSPLQLMDRPLVDPSPAASKVVDRLVKLMVDRAKQVVASRLVDKAAA